MTSHAKQHLTMRETYKSQTVNKTKQISQQKLVYDSCNARCCNTTACCVCFLALAVSSSERDCVVMVRECDLACFFK